MAVVAPIIPSIDKKKQLKTKSMPHQIPEIAPKNQMSKDVSFTGFNPVVGLMDFIDAGGYAASFILQDGIGFIAPRVGKGILRGGKEKRDANGNVVLDKHGNPKHEYNWEYARKEGIREVVTGPSAFLIPLGMLALIKKVFGRANNVRMDYIDAFKKPFINFAKNNINSANELTASREAFYSNVFAGALEETINSNVPSAEKMSQKEIKALAKEFSARQIQVEDILNDKTLKKSQKKQAIKDLGGSVDDLFMSLKKNKIGGTVNETTVEILSSKGKKLVGGISDFTKAMADYFDDAVKSTNRALKNGANPGNLENIMRKFTSHKLTTRLFTNLGLFGLVAAFYTQIPKLYNMGLKSNPALKGTVAENPADIKNSDNVKSPNATKDVNFTGLGSVVDKTGNMVMKYKGLKSISDIFELNGPIISGSAMATLLYGFCIPPRLQHAQDKYDYGEIVVRDLTSFTALLFGAKALSRLFSDAFTKLTGLALNKKNMEGRTLGQKILDYLNPADSRHSVLSSKQLDSKYTNIHQYRNGINGFMEFIEGSGGDVKKAFAKDKNIKKVVSDIVKKATGKLYNDATSAEIKQALASAKPNSKSMKDLYKLFEKENGLLNKAKTCNSFFGFASTLVLVPGLIWWLTNYCEKMTKRRTERDMALNNQNKIANQVQTTFDALPTKQVTMAGFLGHNN